MVAHTVLEQHFVHLNEIPLWIYIRVYYYQRSPRKITSKAEKELRRRNPFVIKPFNFFTQH